MSHTLFPLSFLAVTTCLVGCGEVSRRHAPQAASSPAETHVVVPAFDADSAYAYVARQLDFGPRVPGTAAQAAAAVWLRDELSRHGAEAVIQQGHVTAYDGTLLPIRNVIGTFRPEATRRVLLVAHWDSRPVADHDADPRKRQMPVPAANDGASGVGVLLEIARQLGRTAAPVGIDILFADAEDYGAPDDWSGRHRDTDWGLGTQYWCRRPHAPGYTASFGILLDMVGAENAVFHREYFSTQFAPTVLEQVWAAARATGHGAYFSDEDGGAITDDHYFINTLAGIPTIDIIHTTPQGETTFFPYWHTTDDTLDKISPATLRAVGETLLHVLYHQ